MDQDKFKVYHVETANNIKYCILGNCQKRKALSYVNNDTASNGIYQIAICQDGKFVVTFDTDKIRYRK